MTEPVKLYTPKELAQLVGVDPNTIYRWAATWKPTISERSRKGPRPTRINRNLLFRADDVAAFIESCTVQD